MDEDLLPEINDKHPQVPTYHRRAMEDHYPGGGGGGETGGQILVICICITVNVTFLDTIGCRSL